VRLHLEAACAGLDTGRSERLHRRIGVTNAGLIDSDEPRRAGRVHRRTRPISRCATLSGGRQARAWPSSGDLIVDTLVSSGVVLVQRTVRAHTVVIADLTEPGHHQRYVGWHIGDSLTAQVLDSPRFALACPITCRRRAPRRPDLSTRFTPSAFAHRLTSGTGVSESIDGNGVDVQHVPHASRLALTPLPVTNQPPSRDTGGFSPGSLRRATMTP
jgi:hypothetical protein